MVRAARGRNGRSGRNRSAAGIGRHGLAASAAAAWALASHSAGAQQIVKLPMPQGFAEHEIRLQWETDADPAGTEHVVEWGLAGVGEVVTPITETIAVSPTRFLHRAILAGLGPSTAIQYRVRSGAAASPVFATSTAPPTGSSFRIGWIADNQNQAGTPFSGVLARLVEHDVEWIGHAGDTVQLGTDVQQWHDHWYLPLAGADGLGQRVPILVGRGNHDGESATAYAYHWLPGNGSWYAITVGPVRFVFLDSNRFGATAQTDWLAQELASDEARAAAFRIVVFHKPPYTNLWHNSDGYNGETFVRSQWVPLFEQYGVDLVVSGHAHAYQRGDLDGVRYTTVGGAGGLLDTFVPPVTWEHIEVALPVHHFAVMDASARRLAWRAYDLEGAVFDSFRIDAPPSVPSGSLPWWIRVAPFPLAALALSRHLRGRRRRAGGFPR